MLRLQDVEDRLQDFDRVLVQVRLSTRLDLARQRLFFSHRIHRRFAR